MFTTDFSEFCLSKPDSIDWSKPLVSIGQYFYNFGQEIQCNDCRTKFVSLKGKCSEYSEFGEQVECRVSFLYVEEMWRMWQFEGKAHSNGSMKLRFFSFDTFIDSNICLYPVRGLVRKPAFGC